MSTVRHLTVSVPVRAPSGFTLAYVRTSFEEKANSQNALGLSLPLPTSAGDVSIGKPVTVEIGYINNGDGPDAFSISWSTEDSGAFPRFVGRFATSAEGQHACRLALTGSYTPPGGTAVVGVDAVLGGHVARATMEALLQKIATGAEFDYRARMAL